MEHRRFSWSDKSLAEGIELTSNSLSPLDSVFKSPSDVVVMMTSPLADFVTATAVGAKLEELQSRTAGGLPLVAVAAEAVRVL